MPTMIPAGAPRTMGEAFSHINAVTSPTIDDLKVMVLLEAAGPALYSAMAQGTDNAHRVAKAIAAMSGEAFLPPADKDNPYLAGPISNPPITVDGLRNLAQVEFDGEGLYERWAANCVNAEAAKQFRLNAGEEREHGDRLIEAAALL